MLWMMLFLYPLMSAMQMISARIGRVAGHGRAAIMRRLFPSWAGQLEPRYAPSWI
ncbi:hypothetical protein FB004_10363 [Sinorhizobium medicae]|uniref:hypothetical protein n=2 Tax=Sinorhizobium medicae TaxID=110321 RepID=UPI0011AC51E3|nr:hypothetical protein FB004_10363 [Sinorhizobium medicae]